MNSTSTINTHKKMFFNKTSFLVFMLTLSCINTFSQHRFQLVIRPLPSMHSNDSIYIAGSFNNWDPGNEKYRLLKMNGNFSASIQGLETGIYSFKFTRGSWSKTESDSSGKDIGNRVIKLESDTIIECSIAGWKDDFPEIPKQHTASPNVTVMDTAFFMPQLNRTRKIWIYLPPGYAGSKKKYPVLYMHDGQNLFDELTSAYGEWGVDECLDSLIDKGKPACIVVGIDNGPKRLNEYNPYDHAEYGKAEGEEYVKFLVETLKPYIDKNYRTLSSKENTFIAGSSVGGVISYYAMLRYPDKFGKAGIFSPSFWIAPGINNLTDSVAGKINGQFFFFAGEQETESMIANVKMITDKLGENSRSLIYFVTDPEGKHNEISWRKWFEEFYLWITGNGLSYQIKLN